jgi:hypothetical protein
MTPKTVAVVGKVGEILYFWFMVFAYIIALAAGLGLYPTP